MTARQAGRQEAEGLQAQSGWRAVAAAAGAAPQAWSLKDELLKGIWHAFTALDLDHSGKVSKSQLKVGTPSPDPYSPLLGARSTIPGGSGQAGGDHREWQPRMWPSGLLGVEGVETGICIFGLPLVLR